MAQTDSETELKPDNSSSEMETEVVKPPLTTPKFARASKMKETTEQLAEALKLPKPPSAYMTLDKLQDWLNSLTDEVLPRLVIYVYRLYPIIKREQADPTENSNIQKIYPWIDDLRNPDLSNLKDCVIKQHGGGRYKLIISDVERMKSGKSGIVECKFIIPESEVPPILNIQELDVFAPDNRSYVHYLKAKGILDKEGNVIETNKPMGGNNIDPIAIMKQTADIYKSMQPKDTGNENNALNKGLADVMVELTRQNDPTKVMTMLETMMKTVKGSIPPPAPDGSSALLTALVPMLIQIMQMSQKSSENTTAMMLKMMELSKPIVNPSASTDPFDGMSKMMLVMEQIENFKANRNRNGENDEDDKPKGIWDRVLDVAEKVAPALLPIISGGLKLPGSVPMQNQGMQGVSNHNPFMNQPNVATPLITQGNGQIAVPAGNQNTYDPYSYGPSGPPLPPEQMNTPVTVDTQPMQSTNGQPTPGQPATLTQFTDEQILMGILQQYGGMIAMSIKSGQKGYELASSLMDIPGVNAFEVIQRLKQISIETMLGIFKNVPQFWSMVGAMGDDYVKGWIYEFLNFEEAIKKLDEEDAGEIM